MWATRVRDELTMIVDDKEKLERQLDHNAGNKTSALETVGRLDIDGKKGGAKPVKFDPGPIDGINLADQPDILADLPPFRTGRLSPQHRSRAMASRRPRISSPKRQTCRRRCPSAAWALIFDDERSARCRLESKESDDGMGF